MGNFCQYCGKALVDGKCDCAEYTAMLQAGSDIAQGAPAANGFDTAAAKGVAVSAWDMFMESIKRPATASAQAMDKRVRDGLLVGAVQLVVLLLTMWIHLPLEDMSGYIDGGDRFRLAFYMVVIAAFGVAVTACIAWLFIRRDSAGTGFVQVLAAYCPATAYGTIGLLIAFLLGFVATEWAMLILSFVISLWWILSILTSYRLLTGDADKRVRNAMLVAVIALIIFTIVISVIVNAAINSLPGYITNSLFGSSYLY